MSGLVRACSSYGSFIQRAMRLTHKLLEQGYIKERLKSSLRKFYGRYGDLIKQYGVSQMLNDILWPDLIQWQPPTDQTLYRTRPFTEFWVVSIEHLRWVWHAERGRLLIQTSGPVPLGLAFFRTCRYFSGLCSSNIPRYFLDFALYWLFSFWCPVYSSLTVLRGTPTLWYLEVDISNMKCDSVSTLLPNTRVVRFLPTHCSNRMGLKSWASHFNYPCLPVMNLTCIPPSAPSTWALPSCSSLQSDEKVVKLHLLLSLHFMHTVHKATKCDISIYMYMYYITLQVNVLCQKHRS